jgi:hypothetical protein
MTGPPSGFAQGLLWDGKLVWHPASSRERRRSSIQRLAPKAVLFLSISRAVRQRLSRKSPAPRWAEEVWLETLLGQTLVAGYLHIPDRLQGYLVTSHELTPSQNKWGCELLREMSGQGGSQPDRGRVIKDNTSLAGGPDISGCTSFPSLLIFFRSRASLVASSNLSTPHLLPSLTRTHKSLSTSTASSSSSLPSLSDAFSSPVSRVPCVLVAPLIVIAFSKPPASFSPWNQPHEENPWTRTSKARRDHHSWLPTRVLVSRASVREDGAT